MMRAVGQGPVESGKREDGRPNPRMGHSGTAPPRYTGLVNRLVTSATNYQLAMVSDLGAALAFFVLGLHRFVAVTRTTTPSPRRSLPHRSS
jgi:hypothetical protein